MNAASLHTPGTLVTPGTPAAPGTASDALTRPGIVSLIIKDEAGLHTAYMSSLKNDGISMPTQRLYRTDEETSLVLSLLDRPQKYQVAGKVVWITPVGTPAKTPGINVYLGEDK